MDGVERITLPDGGWWDIRTVVTRGMRKAFRKAQLLAFIGSDRDGLGTSLDLSDPGQIQQMLQERAMAHPERWDLAAQDDAYLLYGTLAWSYGEQVNQETIDSKPDSVTELVLARIRELYAEPTEQALKN